MSDDFIQQHTARIEFHNKVEYAIFYEKTGIHLDIEVTYPSLESAQWSLSCHPTATSSSCTSGPPRRSGTR